MNIRKPASVLLEVAVNQKNNDIIIQQHHVLINYYDTIIC